MVRSPWPIHTLPPPLLNLQCFGLSMDRNNWKVCVCFFVLIYFCGIVFCCVCGLFTTSIWFRREKTKLMLMWRGYLWSCCGLITIYQPKASHSKSIVNSLDRVGSWSPLLWYWIACRSQERESWRGRKNWGDWPPPYCGQPKTSHPYLVGQEVWTSDRL